jgi:hypothetical protein
MESGAAPVIVARRRQRRILTLLQRIRRQHDEYTKGGKCGKPHALLLERPAVQRPFYVFR